MPLKQQQREARRRTRQVRSSLCPCPRDAASRPPRAARTQRATTSSSSHRTHRRMPAALSASPSPSHRSNPGASAAAVLQALPSACWPAAASGCTKRRPCAIASRSSPRERSWGAVPPAEWRAMKPGLTGPEPRDARAPAPSMGSRATAAAAAGAALLGVPDCARAAPSSRLPARSRPWALGASGAAGCSCRPGCCPSGAGCPGALSCASPKGPGAPASCRVRMGARPPGTAVAPVPPASLPPAPSTPFHSPSPPAPLWSDAPTGRPATRLAPDSRDSFSTPGRAASELDGRALPLLLPRCPPPGDPECCSWSTGVKRRVLRPSRSTRPAIGSNSGAADVAGAAGAGATAGVPVSWLASAAPPAASISGPAAPFAAESCGCSPVARPPRAVCTLLA